MSEPSESLKTTLNRQTGKINWSELERFHAAGDALWVDNALDLIDVAEKLADDDHAIFSQWMASGQVNKVTDQQALNWHEVDSVVWAVVVSPWVLVQDVTQA